MKHRNMIQSAVLVAGAIILIASNAQGTGATGQKYHKIVIQVSDDDAAKWNLAMNNAKNLQDDVGAANVDVGIVAYGPGIGMLKADAR